MCTTIGFKYQTGVVFGRTLELGMPLNNYVLYIPKGHQQLQDNSQQSYESKYALLGTGFVQENTLGDGINSEGLMGSSNLLPSYASFANSPNQNKRNMSTAEAFNYLLSCCKDVQEVKEAAKDITIVAPDSSDAQAVMAASMHFYFKDASDQGVVLEPHQGELQIYDNPYGILTNAPKFDWHTTNLKNYLNLTPKNIEEAQFNGVSLHKFGEGSGLVGLPGDFTPPSRFVRAAFFVSHTPKDLERQKAILQAFRILSQSDIPTGAVVDPEQGTQDQTLYTAVMDTEKLGYFVKCHDNINIQSFYLDDFDGQSEIQKIELAKTMNL